MTTLKLYKHTRRVHE